MTHFSPQELEFGGATLHSALCRQPGKYVTMYTDVYTMFFTEALLPIKEVIEDRDTEEIVVVFVERQKAIQLLKDRFNFLSIKDLNRLGAMIRGRS